MTFTVEVNWDKDIIGLPVRVRHLRSAFNVGDASQSLNDTFDVVTGDLIVIFGYTPGDTDTLATPTWTGTGTVTLREAQTGVTGHPNMYVWTIAVTATAINRSINIVFSGANNWGFTATVWRNHGGIGDTGKGASTIPAGPLFELTTTAGSALEVGFDDWAGGDGSDRSWLGSPIVEQLYYSEPGNYTVVSGYLINTGADDYVDTVLGIPNGATWSGIGIEILGLTTLPVSYFDDVTSLVLGREGVSLQYGRDQSTALAPTVSGRGSMTLNNRDRRFSPRNILSPLYGKVKPARPVRITREMAGTEYVIFQGHTDDSPINPDVDNKSVTLSMVDSLADFRGVNISTALYAGIYTGEAINLILDKVGFTPGRDLDRGATVIPWWWEEGTDALEALEKLIRCEGPPALLTMGADGGIIFKDRHHRLLDTPSITSQGTWRNVATAGVGPVMTRPFVYDDAWRNIINTGLISVDIRTPTAQETIWQLESPIGFTANENKSFIVEVSDPFMNAVEPVSGTDYTVIAGTITSSSLSRTSGASTTITLGAGSGGAQISNLQLRAIPVKVAYTTQVAASDPVSIADYGPRSFPGDLPFCNQYDAQAVLDTAVQMRAQPLPVVTARFIIGNQLIQAAQILSRDLSDRVTIVESETVLNDDFYVESLGHDFTGEHDHAVTVGLEAAPPDGAATAANVFIIGGGAGHQIGDGVLAS